MDARRMGSYYPRVVNSLASNQSVSARVTNGTEHVPELPTRSDGVRGIVQFVDSTMGYIPQGTIRHGRSSR